MAIVFTKYEDTANNNIVFDTSKFDYGTDDDFPSEAATDADDILSEYGAVFYVVVETETTDGMGAVSSITAGDDKRIYGLLQDITKKDRLIHDMGLAVPGNRKLFYKPSYDITSAGTTTTHTIQEGDILKDRSDNRWRIIQILKEHYLNNVPVFNVAIVRSIGLEGSG